MINREEAFVLLKRYLKDADSFKFSLSVEAVLKKLAKILHRDKELWALTGLLHNLDYEYTARELENRGTISAQLLDGLLPDSVVNAIKANNDSSLMNKIIRLSTSSTYGIKMYIT